MVDEMQERGGGPDGEGLRLGERGKGVQGSDRERP